MFESQYNDEMEAEVKRLEAHMRAINAGHSEWVNACAICGVSWQILMQTGASSASELCFPALFATLIISIGKGNQYATEIFRAFDVKTAALNQICPE